MKKIFLFLILTSTLFSQGGRNPFSARQYSIIDSMIVAIGANISVGDADSLGGLPASAYQTKVAFPDSFTANLNRISESISGTAATLDSMIADYWRGGVSLNVKSYGVKGDSSDDYIAIQNVIDVVPDHSVLYFPNGKYRIGTGLAYSDKSLTIIGQSRDSVIFYPDPSITTFLWGRSTLASYIDTIVDTVVANDNKIIVSDVSNFSAGDMILIQSTAAWYYDASYPKGEIHIIDRVGVSDTIYLDGKTWDSYNPATETITIVKISPVSFSMKNCSIIYNTNGDSAYGIYLQRMNGIDIDNVLLKNVGINAIGTYQSANIRVTNSVVSNSNTSGYGYGISISASTTANIDNNTFYSNRADIDITSGGSIPSRDVIVSDNHSYGSGVYRNGVLFNNTVGACFLSAHGSAEFIEASGNTIQNKIQGFRMRGANIKIHDNFATGKMDEYLQINSGANYTFENNTYSPATDSRVNLSSPTDQRSLSLYRVVVINSEVKSDSSTYLIFRGNTISGLKETFLELEADLHNVRINDNTIIFNRDVEDPNYRASYRLVWDNITIQGGLHTVTNASISNNHITTINGSFRHDYGVNWVNSLINYDLTNDGSYSFLKGGVDITDSLSVGNTNTWMKGIESNADSVVIELGSQQLIVKSDSTAYIRATPSYCGYLFTSDTILVYDDYSIDPLLDDFSVSTWIVVNATDSSQRYIFNSIIPDKLYLSYNAGTGELRGYMYDGTTVLSASTGDYSGYIEDGEKHLITMVIDRSSKNMELRIDGNFAASYTASTTLGTIGLGGILIGNRLGAGFWDGEIHTLRFWDRALTDDEINILYNRGKPLLKLTTALKVNNVLDLSGLGATVATWSDYSTSDNQATNKNAALVCDAGVLAGSLVAEDTVYAVDMNGTDEKMTNVAPSDMDLNGIERLTTATDSSFEVSIGNWIVVGSSTISQSNTQAHIGTYSMKVITSGSYSGAQLPYANFTQLVSGEKYTFEAWIYNQSEDTVEIVVGDNSKKFNIVATTWYKIIYNFQATASTVDENIQILFKTTGKTNYVDVVSITQAYDAFINVWVKKPATIDNEAIIYQGGFGSYGNTGWGIWSDGSDYFFDMFDGSNQELVGGFDGGVAATDGEWHLLTFYVDRTGYLKIGADGILSAFDIEIGNTNNASALILGSTGVDNYFEGLIGEMQVVKFADISTIDKTAARLYKNGIRGTHFPSSYPSGTIVAWYKFTGASDGVMLQDWSASGNDLTGTNVTQAADQTELPTGYK